MKDQNRTVLLVFGDNEKLVLSRVSDVKKELSKNGFNVKIFELVSSKIKIFVKISDSEEDSEEEQGESLEKDTAFEIPD